MKAQLERKKRIWEEELEARRVFGTSQIKVMLQLLKEKEEDYFFRSQGNEILSKTIDRILLIQDPFVFQP